MSLDRFADVSTARAADRVDQQIAEGAIERWGRPLEVFNTTAGAEIAVEHGLGEIPDGFFVILALAGQVRASRYHAWTTTTAYLVADTNNTRARVIFVTCRKDIANG